MRIVVALGGNALQRRGEPMTVEGQRAQRGRGLQAARPGRRGARAGHLPRQRAAGRAAGAPGGRLRRGVGLPVRRPRRADRGDDRLPDRAGAGQPAAVGEAAGDDPDDDEVDPDDPAFSNPTKFVGPVYTQEQAPTSWPSSAAGSSAGRRQVAARRPVAGAAAGSSRSARSSGCSTQGCVVICAGGGGIPTMYPPRHPHARRRRGGHRQGPRQRRPRPGPGAPTCWSSPPTSTAVYLDWGTPQQRAVVAAHPDALDPRPVPGRVDGAEGRGRGRTSPARRGGPAVIGSLEQLSQHPRRRRRDTDLGPGRGDGDPMSVPTDPRGRCATRARSRHRGAAADELLDALPALRRRGAWPDSAPTSRAGSPTGRPPGACRSTDRTSSPARSRRRSWAVALAQLRDPMNIMLIAVAVASLLIAQVSTAVLVAALVAAQRACSAPGRSSRRGRASTRCPSCRCRRPGCCARGSSSWSRPRRSCPGDVVRLEAGDIVPADGRIVRRATLETQEAALTGESAPISKGADDAHRPRRGRSATASNMLFQNTSVTRGTATMVVTATGMQTEMGRIATMLTVGRPAPGRRCRRSSTGSPRCSASWRGRRSR